MPSVNISDTQTQLSQLVDIAVAGEDVVVCRNGKPVARITRLVCAKGVVSFGLLKGQVKMAPEFNAPLSAEVLAAFERR